MIYLDNAATTAKKPGAVYSELNSFIKYGQANPGRSSHELSLAASERIYEAREAIANLFSIDDPERVVFTYNATYAINLALKTTLREKCHVIISDVEHNAVIRVLEKLKVTIGLEYSAFNSDELSEESLDQLVRSDTVAIVSSLASNVVGKPIDERVLSSFAKKRGLKLILDASQAAGHRRIDLKKNPCHILCAPGHKALFGLMGSGFCIFQDKKRTDSFIEGGSGSDSLSPTMPILLPEAYEAGTLGTPAIIALGAGVKYVMERGEENIEKNLDEKCCGLLERLLSIKGIRVLGCGSGILSFIKEGYIPDLMCREYDRRGICLRSGLHCAPEAHKKLGTLDTGAIRVSLSDLTKKSELDAFLRATKEILS